MQTPSFLRAHGRLSAALLLLVVVTIIFLRWEGRRWVDADGSLALWTSAAGGPHTSQRFMDPYSFSHVLHGFLFYGGLALAARRWPALRLSHRFFVAALLEAGWELLENSSLIIARYRNTAAAGYIGDSIYNSLGDQCSCALGFWLAHFLGFRRTLVLLLAVELGMLLLIRDNLTLNIIMLAHPFDAIRQWQLAP